MPASGEETTLILQATAAITLLGLAVAMIMLTLHNSSETQGRFFNAFLMGKGLRKRGETFRLIGFLAIMFAFINTLGAIFLYIAINSLTG